DRWNGLRMSIHRRLAPAELWGVDRRHVHHGERHVRTFMDQLRPHGLEKAPARELRRAIRGLQRDADVRECGSDVDDASAVAWSEMTQRDLRTPDLTEEGHLNGSFEIGGCDIPDRAEHRGHRVVHPDVDFPEFGFDVLG